MNKDKKMSHKQFLNFCANNCESFECHRCNIIEPSIPPTGDSTKPTEELTISDLITVDQEVYSIFNGVEKINPGYRITSITKSVVWGKDWFTIAYFNGSTGLVNPEKVELVKFVVPNGS